jgi:hypothetical protein
MIDADAVFRTTCFEDIIVEDQAILWHRLDTPGHESCRCERRNTGWHLSGAAVFVHEGQPCRLDYAVVCNAGWQTVSGAVAGWIGHRTIAVEVALDALHRWRLNGVPCPSVAGCTDIDLNFSPATNLLPIRRLKLAVGQAARVTAAWLRFPDFSLESLEQRYQRLDEDTYRYTSAGGNFSADLQVNRAGFVTFYPGFYQVAAESEAPAGTGSLG